MRPRRLLRTRVVPLLAAVGAFGLGPVPAGRAAGATVPAVRTAVAQEAPSLQWRTCPQGAPYQCATLTVPVDYSHPDDGTMGIAVLRVRARNPSARIGSLLVNPGGPGVSARTFARQAARLLPDRITDRFDIVGFDPRGVGGSEPVRCLTDAQEERFFAVDPDPDDDAEHTALVTQARTMADACRMRFGGRLARISTDDVVLDMEQLRIALGEDKLSYAGFSYGTMLGVLYADKFPQRVRAFVLDGMLDPTASSEDRNRAQAIGFERALQAFLADCGRRARCALRGPEGAVATYGTLMADIDRSPLRVGRRSVGPAEAITAVVSALYNRERGWPRLEAALADARSGDGAGLLAMADAYVDRSAAGRYADTNDANQAINCVDAPAPRDVPSYDEMAARLAVLSPNFGAVVAYFSLPCAFWPEPSPARRALPTARGSAPILVVGTTGDPATPFEWAQRVSGSLENARLLVYEGEGHTAYIGGPLCITKPVEDYLVTGRVPNSGTRCRR